MTVISTCNCILAWHSWKDLGIFFHQWWEAWIIHSSGCAVWTHVYFWLWWFLDFDAKSLNQALRLWASAWHRPQGRLSALQCGSIAQRREDDLVWILQMLKGYGNSFLNNKKNFVLFYISYNNYWRITSIAKNREKIERLFKTRWYFCFKIQSILKLIVNF